MSLAHRLIQNYFSSKGGELYLGGLPVTSLVASYGTPIFVYDCAVIDRKLDLLRKALPGNFAISYSVKANPSKPILRHFVGRGCGLEVASAGEFCRALSEGCAPDKILFAGPGKTEAELEYVLSRAIGEIHVESLVEAKRIGKICRRLKRRAAIAVRVNPGGTVQGGAMRMGGKPAPFGVDEETLDEFLGQVALESALDVQGIHLFIGTQILDHNLLMCQYRRGLDIARKAARILNRPLKTVDFGGGLGIPYFESDAELDMEQWRRELAEMASEIGEDPCLRGATFIVEPGRYLVGEAGVYIARVIDIKISRGKKFLILDGGMNHHLAASGNLGQVIKRNFPMAIANKLDGQRTEVVDVVGPLCTPLDTLGRSVELVVAEVGDLVGIFQSGAYALSASPNGFLSHPRPAELWLEDGRVSFVQARGAYSDFR